jgi:Fe-S-cluster-containing dehydrogenase component
MHTEMHLMMKCDMCYDRSSVGKKPMCASVCPSQALFFGTRAEIEKLRPNSRPINTFKFGGQSIKTKVNLMVPKQAPIEQLDVTAAIYEPTVGINLEDELWLANLDVSEVSA